MSQYAYIYRYDGFNRCSYKKLPGCEPVYYIYDKAGRLILSQDGEQRSKGCLLYTSEGGGSSELKVKDMISPLDGMRALYGDKVVYTKGYAAGRPMYGTSPSFSH